jgi:S-disulfanyl-L-cysteine oxidoreductase SoxD
MPTPSSFLLRSLAGAAGAAALLIAARPLDAQQPVVADPTAIKQVDLGGQWFRSACYECHASNLSDPDFRAKWSGKSAFELYDRMRNTMPDSDPGGLTPETYVALTAYLLKLNGVAAGTAALSTDSTALSSIKLAFPSSQR